MSLGPYASFILTAYGAAAVILLSLVAWIVFDHRAQKRTLGEFESQGISRRSDRAAGKRT